MNINISHLRTYLECPTKAQYLYHLHRAGKAKYVALELGTLWHIGMESRLNHIPLPAIETEIQTLLGQLRGSDIGSKVDKGWTSILPAFREWQIPNDWTILAAELELNSQLPNSPHNLQGRLDALVSWNGFYWHLQHKTVGASTPLALYFAAMERDWHECAYQYMAEGAGYTPYAGTILNTVRKLSAKAIKENPKRALAIQYIPRAPEQVAKAILDITTICDQIEAGWADPIHIVQNRSACFGRYGNSPCPYLGVCNGEASLYDDSIFEDSPDRYSPPSPSESEEA